MPDQYPVDKHRYSRIMFVVVVACLTAGAALLANLFMYLQVKAWQMLFMIIAEAVTILGMLIARRLAIKNKMEAAGILALFSVFLGFGAGELVHQGLTIYLVGGGILLLSLVGNLFLPRRFLVWILFLFSYLAYFWAVNQLSLLPRYDVLDLFVFRLVVIIIIALAVILGIWQFIRVLRFGSIRTRLLAIIVTLALLPALVIGALSSFFGITRSIERTQYQLGAVADLKMLEINSWLDSLTTNLQVALPSSDQVGYAEMLLKDLVGTQSEDYRVIYEREKNRFQQVMTIGRVFTEIFLVDMSGKVVVSTDSNHEGYVEQGYNYYNLGLQGGGISTPFRYPYNDELSIIASVPVTNNDGEQIGLIAGRANLASLETIMLERAGLGQQGESYLLATNTLQLLTQSIFEGAQVGDYIYSMGISIAAERGVNGEGRYENPWGMPVLGAYRAMPEMGMVLLSEIPESEALLPVYQTGLINVFMTVGTLIIAVIVALLFTNRLTRPITELASTAEQISLGNLDLVAKTEQKDEIGALAGAFNRMTTQLRKILTGLEEQVNERTAALEQRTNYLQASADVSRAIASVLDPDQLIISVVDLVRDRFDLYYVGLFLLDSLNQYAILRAGTGSAGEAMLSRQHRIPLGSGMIGWCIANRTSRIAQHAELDASRLVNPELPDTRSEAAIPLISRGEVIGALTIQSTQEEVFDTSTIAVFETMADQVAVALDNARLYVQSQQTLESMRELYGEITLEGWRKLLDENPQLGSRSELGTPLSQEVEWDPEMVTTYSTGELEYRKTGNGNKPQRQGRKDEDSYYLGVPLKVREHVIGVLGCYKSMERGEWSQEEMSFMQEVGQTISVALESARFFNEAQVRAENERVIADITGQLRQTLDIDTVLSTAVREIQRILSLAEVEIRISDDQNR